MIESKPIIEKKINCHIVGEIGKILIIYKKNHDKSENFIVIPD